MSDSVGTRAIATAILALFSANGCRHGPPAPYWTRDAAYTIRFSVSHRPAPAPGYAEPQADVGELEIHIDSLIGDSLIGRYLGDLDSIGVPLGVIGRDVPRTVRGFRHGTDFRLVISPDAADAKLVLSGVISHGQRKASGNWHREAPARTAGQFQMIQIMHP